MACKIRYFGYDIYELAPDMGSGKLLKTKVVTNEKLLEAVFGSKDDVLKAVCAFLGTEYHQNDWCFEEDLDDKGNDGYVLHIIVDGKNRFATQDVIEEWKNGEFDLYDLLVNVFVDEV